MSSSWACCLWAFLSYRPFFASSWRTGERGERRAAEHELSPHAEQARRIAAENCHLVVVAERRRGEDVIDGMLLPWDRMVAAYDDLARADLGDQMTEPLGREHQRIE